MSIVLPRSRKSSHTTAHVPLLSLIRWRKYLLETLGGMTICLKIEDCGSVSGKQAWIRGRGVKVSCTSRYHFSWIQRTAIYVDAQTSCIYSYASVIISQDREASGKVVLKLNFIKEFLGSRRKVEIEWQRSKYAFGEYKTDQRNKTVLFFREKESQRECLRSWTTNEEWRRESGAPPPMRYIVEEATIQKKAWCNTSFPLTLSVKQSITLWTLSTPLL